MKRTHFGTVRFQDTELNQMSELRLSTVDSTQVAIFLDQDAFGATGIGGDCEFGLDRDQAKNLLQILDQSQTMKETGKLRWEEVGSVGYAWCDQDEEGDPPGNIRLEASKQGARIIIHPSPRQEDSDYVAAFGYDELKELRTLIHDAMREADIERR